MLHLETQNNMSQDTFQSEFSEFCYAILLYERSQQALRQQLFNTYSITPHLLWAIMFGDNSTNISSDQLFTFMAKNLSEVKRQGCSRLLSRYSSYGDGRIGKKQVWRIFKPKCLEKVDEIVKARVKKQIMPKLLEINFKGKQKIIKIMEKVIEFQEYAEKMRVNLKFFEKDFKNFHLRKVQPKYLQLFMINFFPDILINDCNMIISHICLGEENIQKKFYTFFLPLLGKINKQNPIQALQYKKQQSSHATLEFYNNSKKIWRYGDSYKSHNNPLYLN